MSRRPGLRGVIAAALLSAGVDAWASNGLLFIGFGSESLSMGGADVAVARDTAALNTNPAGLARIDGQALDSYATLTYAVDAGHRDARGNDTRVSERLTPTGGIGYARRLAGTRITVAAGGFVQGGAGNAFDNLATAAGTRDELSAQLGIFKLASGAAYEVNERLRLGGALSLVVATLEQTLFPRTSVLAPAPFFGVDVDGLRASGVNARLGVQALPADRLVLAAAYSPETRLDFKAGTLRSNQSAAGFGVVTYRDARVEGFALPEELSVGAAWSSDDERILLSAKLAWLNWSDALRKQTLVAADPAGPAVAPALRRESPLEWKDQHVLALGLAYAPRRRTTFYAGVNLANNPVPPEALTPLLSPAIARKHLTAGFTHPLGQGYRLSGGMLYVVPEKVTYTNPSLQPLLGANSEARIEYFGLNLTIARSW